MGEKAKRVPVECGENEKTVPACSKSPFGGVEVSKASREESMEWMVQEQCPPWRSVRLDSSIACPMAWRSSLAEITGKSRTRTQASVQMKAGEEPLDEIL